MAWPFHHSHVWMYRRSIPGSSMVMVQLFRFRIYSSLDTVTYKISPCRRVNHIAVKTKSSSSPHFKLTARSRYYLHRTYPRWPELLSLSIPLFINF